MRTRGTARKRTPWHAGRRVTIPAPCVGESLRAETASVTFVDGMNVRDNRLRTDINLGQCHTIEHGH